MTDFLHFKPEGGGFGDPIPIWVDGVWHIYYNKLYCGKGVTWGHIATNNFIDYAEYPDPFTPNTINHPVNTGCVFYDEKNKLFHAYYADINKEYDLSMLHAVSDDGIKFDYDNVALRNDGLNYRRFDAWRDPQVMYDPVEDMYHMVFCVKAPYNEKTPDCFAGLVGHAVSKDLFRWESKGALDLTGIATTFECPDLFKTDFGWALIYYWRETCFRTADTLDGEWKRSKIISPDHMGFMAGKQAYNGNRRVLFGMLPPTDRENGFYNGGNMLIPRNLTFWDKEPQTCFVPEIWNNFNENTPLLKNNSHVIISSGYGGKTTYFGELPDTFAFRMKLSISGKYPSLKIMFGCRSGFSRQRCELDCGYYLMFDTAEKQFRLRYHYEWDQMADIMEIPFEYEEGKEISFDMIVDKKIVEVNLDHRQSLVSRIDNYVNGQLAISVQDGAADISYMDILSRNTGGTEQ